MAETFDEITKRRQAFIRAWRGDNLGSIVNGMNVEDLEWLLERIDSQIKETPHHLLGSGIRISMKQDTMEKLRHQRIFIAGVLGNKKTLEKQSMDAVTATHTNWRTFSLIIGAVIAFGMLLAALR